MLRNCSVLTARNKLTETQLKKRTWVYIMAPSSYDIAPCGCGNQETQWSEYEGYLWCDKCQKDFVPEHNGVFDGPIPAGAAKMLGMTFDRMEIATGNIKHFNTEEGEYCDMKQEHKRYKKDERDVPF